MVCQVYTDYPTHDAFFLGPEALLCRTRGPDAVPQTHEAAKRGETYQIAFDRLLDEVASAERLVFSHPNRWNMQ